MPEDLPPTTDVSQILAEFARAQNQTITSLFGQFGVAVASNPDAETAGVHWAGVAQQLQQMWRDFQAGQVNQAAKPAPHYSDPVKWIATAEHVFRALPLSDPEKQKRLWEEGLNLFQTVLGQYGIGPEAQNAGADGPLLPRSDRRFADPLWRENPFFAVLHQSYLMLSEELIRMAESVDGLEPSRKDQLIFSTRALIDAVSPSNFALTNPVALARAQQSSGQSLINGMESMLRDMGRGQLSHTTPEAFTVGENIANTPGKVVFETDLFQLIQYTPTTDKVLRTPLVIFPPWINRFYILDLNEKKSFVRWAVAQGVTVFMVSWKSADASMADVRWDDYISSQIEAIDHVCERLKVPSVHTIGYCVAGTTLAATLAVLARKEQADKVKSATFFTAQVDFEEAGDLKHFVDSGMIDAIRGLATDGFIDGRYLAATFNMLRGNELLWNYVENHYLKGEAYPAFDLLYWNGDYTNLPAKWHRNYLRDLYRDNRLVIPDEMDACGVSIDLRKIETPCYIQAGIEDHISPPRSVWKLTQQVSGPWTFLLAGSGHIAGVVNPPAANKYQYWLNNDDPETLEAFKDGATEHSGSWWGHWSGWLEGLDANRVAVRGKRKPGGKQDSVIEDAPGRYVKAR